MFAKGVRYKKEGCQEVEDMWEMYSHYVQSDRFLSDYGRFRDEMLYRSKISSARQSGEHKGIASIVKRQLENKYHEEVLWVDDCSLNQLKRISEYIFEDISLEDLRIRISK